MSRRKGGQETGSMQASQAKTLRERIVQVMPYVGVVVALVILATPTVFDRMDAWRESQWISTFSSTVSSLSADDKARLLSQAQRHNAQLAGDAVAAEGEEELLPYDQQLSVDATTMMGWVEIPSLDVKLPVYHGTGEEQLSAGVGHLQSSSLPVGGASTRCSLTAHSGMAGSRMFDDIRLLVPGDVFVLWTLGDPLAYEVTGSEVVLPEEVASLRIVPGEDLCTLITCTPYGVNSHRLLVHARRCAYEPEEIAERPTHVSPRYLTLVWAIAGLAVITVAWVVWRHVRRRQQGDTGTGVLSR